MLNVMTPICERAGTSLPPDTVPLDGRRRPTGGFIAVVLAVTVLGVMIVLGLHAARGGAANGMLVEAVMVPMRDGVRLQTAVWSPDASGPHPVVLSRGYNATGPALSAPFVKAGYVYVGQATRGHGGSEGANGVADRFFSDGADGYDTLTWISRQAWSNGQVAMYGKSYWAGTQWLAAVEQHPNLKAIIPQVMNADVWQCGYRCNGALSLALAAGSRAFSDDSMAEIAALGFGRYFRHLPLVTMDERVGGKRVTGSRELWKQYVTHDTFDAYWQAITIRGDGQDGKYRYITMPVYLMGGWYDYYAGAAFTSFQRLKEANPTADTRIIVNPSDHLNRVVAGRDFGPGAAKDEITLAIRWLDHVLRGYENGVEQEPPVKIFTMGVNRWREAREWPLAGTRYTKYYLRAPDGARAGYLDTLHPLEEPPSVYTYDPEDPVPTLGGNHSVIDAQLAPIIRAGIADQRPNETRSDVLVWSSPPLEQPLEVTGPVELKLFASSSAPDTDFVARLIDVYPDGTAYNLTEGVLRARFHRSIYEPPESLVPGTIYEFTITLQPTSNVFLAGHRIRLHVTSSCFPLWDRNPNTGHRSGMDAEMQKATQRVYHDRAHPSHLVLPVIPVSLVGSNDPQTKG